KPPRPSIALAAYPQSQGAVDEVAEREMQLLQSFVTSVRELRSQAGAPPREAIAVHLHAPKETNRILRENSVVVQKLANLSKIEEKDQALEAGGWRRSTPDFDVQIVYEKKVDVSAER